MDIARYVIALRGDKVSFSPDFINHSEEEAVRLKLWPDDVPWITDDEISSQQLVFDAEDNSKSHVEPRKREYEKQGLMFDYWAELQIELQTATINNDTELIESIQAKINKYITDREAIKESIPKMG